MKKIQFLVLLLLVWIAGANASDQQSIDIRWKDSVLQVIDQMPMDTMRIKYIQKLFQKKQQEDWTLDLLKSSLTISRTVKDSKYELASLYNIYHFYRFREDGPAMAEALKNLKTAAYAHQSYEYYFLAWSSLLNRESGLGNVGVARIQGERMRAEADSLNYPEGVIAADMTIGMSLRHGKQYKEALAKYIELSKSDLLTSSQRRLVHLTIADLHFRLDEYDKALAHLDKAMAVLNRDEGSTSTAKKQQSIPIEFTYCKVYLAQFNAKRLKIHLDKLASIYDASWAERDIVSYYTYRGGYYSLIDDMPKCYKEYDMAMEVGKNLRNTYMLNVHEMKGQCALDHHDYKVAAESFRNAVKLCYSLNRDIAKENSEAIQSNFQIRKALFEQEASKKHLNMVKIGAIAFVLLILLVVLWHSIHVNKLMRRSAREIHEAWKTVDAANRMKEVFLQKINDDIKEPVATVVECAAILSTSENLSQESRLKYSERIKRHADQLTRLVNSVLELSRLDAGMMKFNVQKQDLIQLCLDVKSMLTMHSPHLWTPTFHTQVETLTAQVDSAWFSKTLIFLLTAPEECDEKAEVTYTLTADNRYASIVIDVPSAKTKPNNSEERINHDICRLYLKAAGGSYRVEDNRIVITYPIKECK